MQDKQQKRAAIYARTAVSQVSTNHALASQVEQCKEYCTRQGYKLLHIYQDEGFSGTQEDRPGLNALRELAKQNEINTLVVCSTERLFRNTSLTAKFINELKQQNITIEFSDKEFSKEVQTLAQEIREGVAEIQKQMIQRRMQYGKAVKKAQREQQ